MKRIPVFFIAIVSFVWSQTQAQTVNFFKDNIYNLTYNPATEITVRQHFGFFISNFNLQVGTNLLIYKKVVSTDNEGNKVIDPKGFFSRIPKSAYGEIFGNVNTELLGYGIGVNPKLYLMFSTRIRTENTVFIPSGLFHMASDGNIAHIGEELTILPMFSMLTYLDNSIGAQYKITDKITVGVRGKFLMGLVGANIKESGFTLTTDDEWNLHLKGSALATLYLPKSLIDGRLSTFTLADSALFVMGKINAGNILNLLGSSYGGGFDLGIDVKLPFNIGVKASLIDMGWIKWDRNQNGATNYRIDINPAHSLYQNGELVYSGENSLDSFKLSSDFFNQMIENMALDSAFLFTETTLESYTMMTHPKLFLEGYYELGVNKFSALLRLDFISKRVLPTFTLGYNLNLKKIIDVALCYSIAKGSYGNFGVGFSLNPGNIFHFYLAADNLTTLFAPRASIFNLNVHTGLFFTAPVKKPEGE